jgi:hypothetical protein
MTAVRPAAMTTDELRVSAAALVMRTCEAQAIPPLISDGRLLTLAAAMFAPTPIAKPHRTALPANGAPGRATEARRVRDEHPSAA